VARAGLKVRREICIFLLTDTMHDYHMHSHWCRHASGSLEEYARAAAAAGIDEICFTPHIPMPGYHPHLFGGKMRMELAEFEGYEEELARARAACPSLTILSGIEADYVRGWEAYVERFFAEHSFDVVLMSVHFVAEWPGDAWVFDLPRDRTIEQIYADYFDAMKEGIATGLYDCVAHLDLVKQPGLPALGPCRDHVEEVIDACRAGGMSIEINTSGLRKPIAEYYPSPEIAALAAERGVRLTPGSDAHAPDQVGLAFDSIFAARSLLAPSLVRYRGRRPLPVAAADQDFCATKLR
jgi:histidinol-phosphatase (PHP family)